jgi:hypothetical protein
MAKTMIVAQTFGQKEFDQQIFCQQTNGQDTYCPETYGQENYCPKTYGQKTYWHLIKRHLGPKDIWPQQHLVDMPNIQSFGHQPKWSTSSFAFCVSRQNGCRPSGFRPKDVEPYYRKNSRKKCTGADDVKLFTAIIYYCKK